MNNKDVFLTETDCEPVLLRPHHGMCLTYFTGHGYSDDFTAHMYKVQNYVNENAVVRLVAETDIICLKCPNNIDGECDKPELVARYDSEVLARCGLKDGDELRFMDFAMLVRERILTPGLRSEICGDCQWNEFCK